MTRRKNAILWWLTIASLACVGQLGRAAYHQKPFGPLEWSLGLGLVAALVVFQLWDTNDETPAENEEIEPVTVPTPPAVMDFARAQKFKNACESLLNARAELQRALDGAVTNQGFPPKVAADWLRRFDEIRDALVCDVWETRPDPKTPVWMEYYHRHLCAVLGDMSAACAAGLPAILAVIQQCTDRKSVV